MLARRIHQLLPSPTLSLDAKVKELQAKGTSIINLTIGEPDFDTPQHIREAAIQALNAGFTHYTPSAGILELRQAIAQKLLTENHLQYSPTEIIVGVGTKQLLYSAFQVLCQKGDEVLIPTPTWSTYVEQVKLADATPVTFPLKSPFILTAAELAKHITKRTKALIFSSPNNPTGAVIPKSELQKIAQLCVKHGIFMIADEIYEKLLYDGEFCSIASLSPEARALTITINGFSKAYAMTGWRVGYAAGPQEIIQGMVNLSGQTTSGTSSISQKAAVAAIHGDQSAVENMQREFQQRRDRIFAELQKIPNITVENPPGAFYFFIDISKLLSKKYPTSTDWTQALLTEAGVALVPGEAFLAPGFVRMSFAAALPTLQEGVTRLTNFI